MSKKVVSFYSKNQVETIQSEIKAGVSASKIARKYASSWNRSEDSLKVKIYKMIRTGDVSTHTKPGRKSAKIVSQDSKGITLSSGFVFDFKPQRAEMHSDHVRLYF
jgi:hypothetical protein